MERQSEITVLLKNWQAGDKQALDAITPIIYTTLQQIAAKYRRREASDLTLQATEIVHEAFIRLVGSKVDWQDRAHFFAIASRTMRHILVDYARAKRSDKRGGQFDKVTLEDDLAGTNKSSDNVGSLLVLNDALERLAKLDKRKADVLEQNLFAGLTYEEIAETLNISAATVDRDLRFAKAWLSKELREDSEKQ